VTAVLFRRSFSHHTEPCVYCRCLVAAVLFSLLWIQRLRWSRGSVLAFGTQVRGFTPSRNRPIFRAKKILSTPSFGGEVKPSVLYRSLTACKRSLNVTWKSAFRQNYLTFLAQSFTFRRWVLSRGDTHGDAWWRKLERLT
jgi:hypothetical protein